MWRKTSHIVFETLVSLKITATGYNLKMQDDRTKKTYKPGFISKMK